MGKCLFCEIAAGRIPCDEIFSDDDLLAFHDINPQAPTHVLVIPRRHIGSLVDIVTEDEALLGHLAATASRIAHELGLDERGYRWVVNCGEDGCQSVAHLHMHLLGGRPMGWPPG